MKDAGIYDTEIDYSRDTVYGKEIDLIGPNKKVLEFGCSTGFVSKILKQRGCRVTGIEMDENAAKKAGEYCEKVIVGDIDIMEIDKELGQEKFDAALFGDILEHLKDPKRILLKTRDFLVKDGYIVISIPNIAHWSTRLELLGGNFDYQKLGILDDSHLKFFTKKSIINLLEACGYFIEAIDFVKKDFDWAQIDYILKAKGFNDVEIKKISLMLNEPDAEAYQYVIKASPCSEHKYLEKISAENMSLEQEIKEKNIRIAEKEKQINELHEVLQNKDIHIKNLEKIIQNQDAQIHNLETTMAEKNKKLDAIYSSLTWRALMKYHRIIERLLATKAKRH